MKMEELQNASILEYWGAYGRAPGRRLEAHGVAHEIWTGIPHVLMNAVLLWRHDPGRTAALAERTQPGSAALGVGTTWWLSPEAQAAGAEAALAEAGFQPMLEMPAMVSTLADAPRTQVPPGLVVEKASGAAARRLWGEITGRGFGFDEAQTRAFADCEASIPDRAMKGQRRFLGYLDGEPVAVSSLVMTGGLAGIYAVATLEDAGNRGIGAAMTAHAMLEGMRLGADQAVLQATAVGQPIYERMGFRRAFDYVLMLQPPGSAR